MDSVKEVFYSAFSQSVLHDIFISTASGTLVYLLTSLLRIPLVDFAVLLFWKSFTKGLTMVMSDIHKVDVEPQMWIGAPTVNLVNFGEAMAMGNMRHFLLSQCKSDPSIISVQTAADFNRIKDRNIFLVGGPKDNLAAKLFLQEIAPELYYQFKRLLIDQDMSASDQDIKIFVGKTDDYPNFTYDFEKETQYATIILRKDLYKEGKYVLCAAGLGNASTFAAVDWILNSSALFWFRVRKQPKGFQAIIKCRVLDQAKVSKLELVFFRELS